MTCRTPIRWFVATFSLAILCFPRAAPCAQPSLVNLKNLRSSLFFIYEFDQQVTKPAAGGSSRFEEHGAEETLEMDLDYSIIKPKYLAGSLGGRLGFDQEVTSSNGTNGRSFSSIIDYHANGRLMQAYHYPVEFSVSSTQAEQKRRFARDYDIENRQYDISWNLSNNLLPAQFQYSTYRYETSGLELDRSSTLETRTASISHAAGPSSSSFVYSTSNSTYETTQSNLSEDFENSSFNINNDLSWLLGRHDLKLESAYYSFDQKGDRTEHRYDWRERLEWVPGEALRGTVDYRENQKETQTQEEKISQIAARLRHRLFESLSTTVDLRGKRREFLSGQESTDSGALGLNYLKKLSAKKRLNLTLVQTYDLIDRDVLSSQLPQIDEQITVSLITPNILTHPDVVADTVVVRSFDRTTTYSEGLDYTTRTIGRDTEIIILPASPINDGDILSVDYEYEVNPSIEYETNSTAFTSSLSLCDNCLTLLGRYSRSTQDLISGRDDLLTLGSSQSYLLGFAAEAAPYSFGSNYSEFDAPVSNYSMWEGYFRYTRKFYGGHFFFNMRDSYTRYKGTSKSSDNTFSTSVGTTYFLARKTQLKAQADYLRSSGQSRDRDNVSLSIVLTKRWRRSYLTFEVEEDWQDYEGSRERTDHVSVSLHRSF